MEVVVHFLRNYTEEEAYEVETMLTRKWGRFWYDEDGVLLNIIHGGTGGMKGLPKPKATKKKMSEAAKLRWQDPEQRKKLNDHKFGNNWGTLGKGMKVSEEGRNNMSAAKKKYYQENPEKHPMLGKTASELNKQKTKEKNSKIWEVTFPDGRKQMVKSLAAFCKDNGLSDASLVMMKKSVGCKEGYFAVCVDHGDKKVRSEKSHKPRKKRTQESRNKTAEILGEYWEIEYPDGTKETIKSLSRWCKQYGVSSGNLVTYGHSKGYKCRKLEDPGF